MDLNKCRGCNKPLLGSKERLLSVQFGELEKSDSGAPIWKVSSPTKSTWGRMHERCFLLAIGDPRGVELTAKAAASAARH